MAEADEQRETQSTHAEHNSTNRYLHPSCNC